jgi:ADP-ribosylglycohydrolase
MSNRRPVDRFTGAMLALACGDALGGRAGKGRR